MGPNCLQMLSKDRPPVVNMVSIIEVDMIEYEMLKVQNCTFFA